MTQKPRKTVSRRSLPLPRLEISWEKVGPSERHAHYHLILPAGKYDIRNVFEHKKDGYFKVLINTTKRTGTDPSSAFPEWPMQSDGNFDVPYRDGAHIQWDSAALKIPAYVVHGNKAQLIEQSTPKMSDDSERNKL